MTKVTVKRAQPVKHVRRPAKAAPEAAQPRNKAPEPEHDTDNGLPIGRGGAPKRPKEDEAAIGNTFMGGNSTATLAEYVKQAERLMEDRDGINEDIAGVVSSAKQLGIIPQVFRKILQRRRMDAEKRRTQDDQLSTCEELLAKYL